MVLQKKDARREGCSLLGAGSFTGCHRNGSGSARGRMGGSY